MATVVDKNALPKQQQLPGSGRNKKIAPVRHRINNRSLIQIQNNDYFCLFYALVATLVHSIFDWSSKKFHRYIRSEHGMANKLREDAIELMENIGAPLDLTKYNAEEWIPFVVDYWNSKYEGEYIFKVFVFGSLGNYEPEFKSGPDNFDTL
uniref:Uncharacterized protein n=1 Tax=Meloidogyne enterolobii TaxID=390850 RepID=A0A6V7TYB4_MELEN|nr:unnamed protein product [Meloidogyne enterolobii]